MNNIAVILWLHSNTFTVSAMPKWFSEMEKEGACQMWVDHVLSMGWSLWAMCI